MTWHKAWASILSCSRQSRHCTRRLVTTLLLGEQPQLNHNFWLLTAVLQVRRLVRERCWQNLDWPPRLRYVVDLVLARMWGEGGPPRWVRRCLVSYVTAPGIRVVLPHLGKFCTGPITCTRAGSVLCCPNQHAACLIDSFLPAVSSILLPSSKYNFSSYHHCHPALE